jgi:hypothetical protein
MVSLLKHFWAAVTFSLPAERPAYGNVQRRRHIVGIALPLQPFELGEGALQTAVVQGLVLEDAVESSAMSAG